MIDRSTRLRWRRQFKRSKRQVEDFGSQAEDNLEQHFFRRLSKLAKVRRFVFSWVILFILIIGVVLYQTNSLSSYYLHPAAASGGIYSEGILGTFTNASPLYAASSVDSSVERLVFSGLFKHDQNNNLVGDLAKNYIVNEQGTTYTVFLKKGVTWHDGAPFNADDVVFTYNMIQNPDAKSPLASSWTGIKVKRVNENTISFTLPSILSAFPYSMTNGIVPKHILDGVPASQVRSLAFNTSRPVGTGPFKWDAVEVLGTNPDNREQRIALLPNESYLHGKPQIDKFIIRTFQDQQKLSKALENRELNAIAGLNVVPDNLKNDTTIRDYNIPLTSEVMVFFKNSNEIFNDVATRKALSLAINTDEILGGLNKPIIPANGPLLKNQMGYDPTIVQNTSNKEQASLLLDAAGWKKNEDGVREKNGKPMMFTLTTQRDSTYDYVSQKLKRQWKEMGIDVTVIPLDDTDMQQAIANHNYDALLYGIAIGADPDVFAFWHSSQADLKSTTRLNLAEFNSPAADKSLEAGRTRNEADVRAVKYKPFLTAWRDNAPAIALYQPRYLYIAREPLYNFAPTQMNTGADRLNSVEKWQIRQTDQAVQ